MNKNIQEAIQNQLDSSQEKYWEGVQWIVKNGMRCSGRTHLLALAFIQEAINSGQPTYVWDHYDAYTTRTFSFVVHEIQKCVARINEHIDEELQLKVTGENRIQILVYSSTTRHELEWFDG